MFNGAMIDVAIGVIVVFLVTSLIASAIVETIGGFLHRRQKHLWDSLDLLLGNTSVADDPDVARVVSELYKKPFITGLVKPSDRPFFEPDKGKKKREVIKVPLRAKPRNAKTSLTKDDVEDLNRRFYGPSRIDPREFANALLSYLRPGGKLDGARDALKALEATVEESTTDVALDELDAALTAIDDAATDVGSGRLSDAVKEIRAAGEAIDPETLRTAVRAIDRAITNLTTGDLTPDEVREGLAVLPRDLQEKLGEVLGDAGSTFVDIRTNIETWFDRNMAAASDWYRRQTRWFLFAAGLFIAVSMNVDAIHAGVTLYHDEGTREALVEVAKQIDGADCEEDDDAPATTDDGDPTISEDDNTQPSTDDQETLDCVRNSLDESISLPIGWNDGFRWRALPSQVVGWVLVAAGVTLGAPFWFDLLRRALAHRKKQGSGGS